MRSTLVTGASGYIASELIAQLLRAGCTVRGSVRSLAKGEELRRRLATRAPLTGLSFVVADLLDPAAWRSACAGVEEVFHVASPFFVAPPEHPDDLIVPAREGTLNVLRAATTAGVRRVVLTSSVAAVAYPAREVRGRRYDERDWSDESDTVGVSAYGRSKTIAERAAWAYVAATPGAPELVTICPGLVLGPVHDGKGSESMLAVRKLLTGELPAVPDFGIELVDVRDVAELHRRAMATPAASGQRFLATAGCRSYLEIAQALRSMFPVRARRAPRVRMPDWGVRLFALVDREARGILNELGQHRACSHARATTLLDWYPRSPEEAIAATVEPAVGELVGVGTGR